MCLSCSVYAQTNVRTHIVKANETLSSIAKHYGVTVNDILKVSPNTAKNVKSGKGLIVGQRLNIPPKKTITSKSTSKTGSKSATKTSSEMSSRKTITSKSTSKTGTKLATKTSSQPSSMTTSTTSPKPSSSENNTPESTVNINSTFDNYYNTSNNTEKLIGKNTYLDYGDIRSGKTAFAVEALLGYFIPDTPDGVETSAFKIGSSVAIGARHHLTEELFGEGFAGIKGIWYTANFKGSSDKTTFSIWDITIPLHIGYRFNTTNNGSYKIIAGTRIDIPVYRKSEFKATKTKMDVPTTFLIEAGFDINFPKTDCRIMYSYSPTNKFEYHLISIGMTTSSLLNF